MSPVRLALSVLLLSAGAGLSSGDDPGWPQWRGPAMNGVSLDGEPPVRWSESSNIRWRTAIPGRGSSTPIVWNDLVLIQTSVPEGERLETRRQLQDWQRAGEPVYEGRGYVASDRRQRFVVLAIDRGTGDLRWQTVVRTVQPHEGIHPTNTWASASPATDGEHIIASFGSQGLYCLDMSGNVLWEKQLGLMDTRNGWGEGASPALAHNLVVVNWDHEGASFVAAFDKQSGRQVWRREREEVTTWSTPLIVDSGGAMQVVTTGTEGVRSYEFTSGDLLWQGPGLTFNSIPTPVAGAGRVYLTSGYRGNAMLAVDLDKARGDIEQSGAIAWRYDRDTPYVSSPVLYAGTLYFLKSLRPILTALSAEGGKKIFGPVRLPELHSVYASPVAAAGRIYIAGRRGAVLVLEHGRELKVLSVNRLQDGFDASPAIVGREMYLRGQRYLYRIQEEESPAR